MIYVEKKEMINELKQNLNNWNDYSEKLYGYSKNDAQDFLKRFRIGIYDCGLNGVLWFGPKVNVDLLVSWDADRRKNKRTFSNISEENLIVYSVLFEIKNHLSKLELYPKAYGEYYKSPINQTIQTPASPDELTKYKALFKKVLTTNYTWREAREIRKQFKQFNIYENKDFPHNSTQLFNCFTPEIIKHFSNFFPGKCIFDTTPIEKNVNKLLQNFNEKEIIKYINEENKSHIDAYIKRQMLSIIDFKKIFSKKKKDYNILKKNFKNNQPFLPLNTYIIFSLDTKKEILNLLTGLLSSLTAPKKTINIPEKCQEFKEKLHCTKSHKLFLPDSTPVEPLLKEKHEKKFIRFQKKYEYLYKKATDLEYVEACLEILGDFLTAQIYPVGNKEIAIFLFNTLLISRGLLPPVIDLNENDYFLLNLFTKDYNERYKEAIPLILKDTVNQTEQFENKKYEKPITIN